MTVRQPQYGKEEFARSGYEVNGTQMYQFVEQGNHGKIV